MATLAGGGPGGDATSLARSVGPQAAPLCGIGRVARPPSARLGRAAGTLNLAQERSAHVRAGPCAGLGHPWAYLDTHGVRQGPPVDGEPGRVRSPTTARRSRQAFRV